MLIPNQYPILVTRLLDVGLGFDVCLFCSLKVLVNHQIST